MLHSLIGGRTSIKRVEITVVYQRIPWSIDVAKIHVVSYSGAWHALLARTYIAIVNAFDPGDVVGIEAGTAKTIFVKNTLRRELKRTAADHHVHAVIVAEFLLDL